MRRSGVVVLACAAVVMMVSAPALGHGHREQGSLSFTVGWSSEPAFVGQPNAVQLRVERNGQPVEGAESTLKVTVSVGDETTDPLDLRTVFDAPGEYRADMIPTVVGGYTFRFTGKIGDTDVDQSFTSPEDGFDEVTGTSDIAFPKQAPSTTELAEKLAAVERDAADAKNAVTFPRVIGIVAAVISVVAAALALARRRA